MYGLSNNFSLTVYRIEEFQLKLRDRWGIGTVHSLRLRDRDAIITREGIIFRVYGYLHPPDAYICDVEYAPAKIFKSINPKALRARKGQVYYKFYSDEGIRFIEANYPQYRVFYEPLQKPLVGVRRDQIWKTRKPEETLRHLLQNPAKDSLHKALHTLSKLIEEKSELSLRHFGVFGSLLQGFYHPEFSDLDLIVYGGKNLKKLCEMLKVMYAEGGSPLRNEFESIEAIKGKRWRFVNYSLKEYLWHQRRKLIYALFEDEQTGRIIKTEFEPVKNWSEIRNEYSSKTRILRKGWIKAIVRIVDDRDAAFMPSIYQIEPIKIVQGEKVEDIRRIISYVEEFRMQVRKDEVAYAEGNLEQVMASSETYHQITLTYTPKYYEQVLKAVKTPT
jgi:predicted nucleotidyltransferase